VKLVRSLLLLAVGAAMLVPPERAPASSPPSCDLISPGFSVSYDPTSDLGKSSIGRVEVDCTTSVPLTIRIDLSAGRSGDYSDRTMLQTAGSSALHYNLLFGSTATPFGDGSSGTQHVQSAYAPANGAISLAQSVRLILGPHQFAVPGQYTDSLVVTVQF
jgi:spore coat protein U-like protein